MIDLIEISSLINKEKFTNRINKTDNCWYWIGAVDGRGYGMIGHPLMNTTIRAHRIAYQLFKGNVGTLHVLHKCDTKLCVNPDHLFLGTHAANMADMRKKGRRKNICAFEKNGRAKLTFEQVKIIRETKGQRRQLATQFNISISQIQRIKAGKQWVTVG